MQWERFEVRFAAHTTCKGIRLFSVLFLSGILREYILKKHYIYIFLYIHTHIYIYIHIIVLPPEEGPLFIWSLACKDWCIYYYAANTIQLLWAATPLQAFPASCLLWRSSTECFAAGAGSQIDSPDREPTKKHFRPWELSHLCA